MSNERVLLSKKGPRKAAAPNEARKPGQAFDYPAKAVTMTKGGVSVYAATSLGAAGIGVAQAVAARVDGDLAGLASLFGVASPKGWNVIISPLSGDQSGDGGAYHYGCQGTDIYVDSCTADPEVSAALFVAEAVEVMSALQGKGWDCGNTNGEGLSRVLAELAYPGKLDDFETASAWLDGGRPNYVDRQQGTDTDAESNGLGVLFLYWLNGPLGFGWDKIVQTGGATLAQLYERLTGVATAWQDFRVAVGRLWPVGKPSGVTSDNPWPATPTPPTPPTPPTEGLATIQVASDSGSLAAGTYMLLPLPSDLDRRLRRAGLSAGQWGALVQAILTTLLTILPTILNADGESGQSG